MQDFYVKDFAVSYGDPQSIEVTAKRSLGNVRLRYRVNDGPVRQAPTKEAPGGERFNNDRAGYYHRLRGVVTGTKPGDDVEVWFESANGAKHSSRFTYREKRDSNNKVLVLAAENYLAGNPAQDPDGPHYLSYYTDALDANGVGYDVYDVDRMGHRLADPLGVLEPLRRRHLVHGRRLPDPQAGPAGRDRHRAARGRGDDRRSARSSTRAASCSTRASAPASSTRRATSSATSGSRSRTERQGTDRCERLRPQYCNKNGTDKDPTTDAFDTWGEFDQTDPTQSDGCIAHNDDFLQYYLGAYIYVSGGNTRWRPTRAATSRSR